MLIKRMASAIILIGVVVATIYIDWVCAIAATVFIGFGLYEFFTMVEKKGIGIYKYFGIGMGLLIPLSILLRFELTKKWELLFVVLALFFLILMQFNRRKNSGVIVDISTTIFGILYVSWFFSFIIKIRYLEGGLGLLAALLLMTKLGDIGAYLVGSAIGKRPLLPRISPKKTVEGAIAGLFFSALGGVISRPFLQLSYPHLIFMGILVGIAGQLGDLSESLMKRDCQIKDSGNLLPGMGGILDEIDSLLFTAPIFYFYMSILLAK
ncbi:MAG: phosphatidate cytidylyltransferase [Candidatus Omnitrophica bacterium]|jgi:phosphatidate cytidylyltransferase|nr:phosphatidate cytidylyltransferase [Candidatus Omnitrophota bacterium]